MKKTVQQVMTYVYNEGIFNEVFGIIPVKGVQFPDGVIGDAKNIRLTIDPSYVLEYLKNLNQTSVVRKSQQQDGR